LSWGSVAGLVTGLQAGQPKNQEFNSRQWQKIFTFGKVQTGSGGHSVSFSMGNGDIFHGGKGEEHTGCEAGHSPLSDVRNE